MVSLCKFSGSRFELRSLFALFAAICLSSTLLAVGSAGTVRGTVDGPDGKPLGGVALTLRNGVTGFEASTRSDAQGHFAFYNVPFNPYELHVEAQGFETQHIDVDVRSAMPVERNVSVAIEAVSANVQVSAEAPAARLETDSSSSHVDIDKSFIEHAPAANPSRPVLFFP